MKTPLIIFLVAISITIPSIVIFYSPVNGEQNEVKFEGQVFTEIPEIPEVHPKAFLQEISEIDPEPTNCEMGMSSVDKMLCKKLDKIIENQEVIFDNQEKIFDLISFWQDYVSGMR